MHKSKLADSVKAADFIKFHLLNKITRTVKIGKVPLITANGLHQLHILIFFLAVFHVAFSAIAMALGRLKIRGWKHWEEETSSLDYEFSKDSTRFRLTHETSFVKAHISFWTKIPFFFYFGCFFRQFFRSVSKSDYLTVRNGFINVHLGRGSKFNFQKYVKRALEDDFQVVVGISPVLWASFVIFLLLNVHRWQVMFWASMLPLIAILAVGTELQGILTKMALEITERHAVVQGIPLVQASDKYFWFSKPHLILHLIHFALFQNAFEITYFFWIWYEYSIGSCFHENIKLVILKLFTGVGVLILCSYITLPLYALVSQMGSNMKKSIFDEQTSKAIMKWRMAVKKKHTGRGRNTGGNSPAPSTPSSAGMLNHLKTTDHSPKLVEYDIADVSDLEAEPLSPKLINVRVDNNIESRQQDDTRNKDHFSFDFSKTLD